MSDGFTSTNPTVQAKVAAMGKQAEANSAAQHAAAPVSPTQQLANEAAMTQAGNKAGAIASSQAYNAPKPATGTSAMAQGPAAERDRPGVITVTGNSVLVNGKMAGNYPNEQAAQAAAQAFTAIQPTGQQLNVMGNDSGSIYRQINGLDKTVSAPTVFSSQQAGAQDRQNMADYHSVTQQMSDQQSQIQQNQTTGAEGAASNAAAGTANMPPTASGDRATDAYNNQQFQLQQMSAATDQAYSTYTNQVAQIQNGTFPLSPADSASLNAIQSSITQAVAAQNQINQAMLGGVTEATIRSGGQRYAPEATAGILGAVVTQGAQAIAKIESEGAQQMASAQQAIQTKDMQQLDDSMNRFRQAMSDKSNVISKMYENTVAFAKSQQDQALQAQSMAGKTLDTLTKAGITPDQLSPIQLHTLDIQQGLPDGTSAALLNVGVQEKAASDQQAQIENASKLTDLLNKLPVGQTVTLNGVDYMSLNQGTMKTYTEDDGNGNTTIISYNEDTGVTTSKTLTGVSAKSGWSFQQNNGVGMFVNPNTGEMKAVFDSNQPSNGTPEPTALKQKFPDGYKPTDAELKAMGLPQLDPATGGLQCGEAVRYWSNYSGPSLSSLDAKKAIIDKNIGTADNPPQAGDAFVQSGGSYGHIGMVLSAIKLPDGSYSVNVLDANSQGNGTVHYHTVNSKNVLGFGRDGFGFKPQFQFGAGGGTLDQSGASADHSTGSTSASTVNQQQAMQNFSVPTSQQKAPTADQAKNASFSMNAKLAVQDLAATEDYISKLSPAEFTVQQALPYVLKNGNYKSYQSAKESFIDAVARRESGAAIPPSEMAMYDRIYFPQPGDSADVRTQKQEARTTALQGLVSGSGSALSPDFLNDVTGSNNKTTQQTQNNSQSLQYKDPNDADIANAVASGWTKTVNSDGSVTITPPQS